MVWHKMGTLSLFLKIHLLLNMQICPSLVTIPDTMTSTWSCVTTAVRWWSLRPSRNIVRGDTALWLSSMHTSAPHHLHLISRDPVMGTPHPPMGLVLGVGETRMSDPRGLRHSLPPHRRSSDTQSLQKMEFGKVHMCLKYIKDPKVICCGNAFSLKKV